jgi:hypothetical protein
MEDVMAEKKTDQTQRRLLEPEAADGERRRDQPTNDAPATVPHMGEEVEPQGSQPPEDGGVAQHPIHDSDEEDLGPEDFEEQTDEVAETGIKTDG